MNLVHSKAVRKPLAAIILNIPSCTMFSNFSIIANMTVSDGVSLSPRGGRRSRPSKSAAD